MFAWCSNHAVLSLRDFNAFVRACEKYGRKQLALIASEVDGKNEEEVSLGHPHIPKFSLA